MSLPGALLEYCFPEQWQLPAANLFLVLLTLLALALATISLFYYNKKGRSIHLPPGPRGLPILGNLHQMVGALPHQSLRELARRHGPVMQLQLGSVPTLVVSSAEAAREVMKTHDADCCSRPDTPGPRRLSYGHKDVAFTPYGKYWREMRKLFIVELLSMRRVKATWDSREAEVEKLIRRLASGEREAVYVQDHIFGLADGVIGTVALGSVYGSEQFAHREHFHQVFDEAMAVKSSFTAEDYFPNAVGRLVDRLTGLAARRERVFRELDAFYEKIIDEHLDPSRAAAPDRERDFIDALIKRAAASSKEEEQGQGSRPAAPAAPAAFRFTRDHVKGMLSDTFIGGVDTSSVTIVWAMAELIRKPHLMKKVQDEIRAAVGTNKQTSRVQPEDLPKLRYLKLVLKETLRLHPAVPLLAPRETLRDVKICGYDVPAKTRIFVNVWAIGRDPASWQRLNDDDPEEFNPDRFDGSDVDFAGAHFELLPFGAGRRICPGVAMAAVTMEFTLASLLYCFDWELPEGMAAEDLSMERSRSCSCPPDTYHQQQQRKWQRCADRLLISVPRSAGLLAQRYYTSSCCYVNTIMCAVSLQMFAYV